ncbi:MAG: CoA-binding protein [Candidatus Zixiibacteriota bacterium]
MYGSGFDWKNPSPEKITELFRKSKTIAVVGLSAKPERPSHGVSKYLQDHGYKIVPVNPNETEILGEKVFSDLASIPDIDDVDIVNIFRRPEEVPGIIDSAIDLGVKAIWMQENVISIPAFKAGELAGVFMVMDRCMFKEHIRLIGK